MITVYKSVPFGELPDMSPFVVKLETYLRMVGLPYETALGDPRQAPNKKVPYILDEGQKIPDTVLIIEHLKRKHGDPLDGHLDPRQRAVAEAFRGLLEQHFYFVIGYTRYWRDEDFALYRPAFSTLGAAMGIPRFMVPLITWKVRRDIKNQFWQQGTGRHSRQEVMEFGRRHLMSVADYLGDSPFFMGERPTTIDATVFSWLIAVLWSPIECEIKDYLKSRDNLTAYCERMRERYWKKK